MHFAVLALAVSILSVWSNSEARIISINSPYVKKAPAPPSFLTAMRLPSGVIIHPKAGDSDRNIPHQSRAGDSDGNSKPQPRGDGSDGNFKPQPRSDESDGNSKPQPRVDDSDGNINSRQGADGQCECGKVNRATRIVGGMKTEVHEYPWQVALLVKPNRALFCGGSIINSQWILTAAHCVDGVPPNIIKAVLGDHNWVSPSETSVTKTLTVVQVIVHNKYDDVTFNNDIALLKLKKTISFNSNNKIAPVCLPSASESYKNVEATVTGWGALVEGGDLPKQLYEVTVPTMTNGKCKKKYGKNAITSNMICAGLDEGGKDACQGDSGGPMVTPNGSSSPRMLQIGIVSWGIGCAQPGYPGVYTRVSRYLDWIIERTGGSTSCLTP